MTLLLLAAAPAFAASVCIVCPAGHDCESGEAVLGGSIGQVLTRTEDGTAWQAPDGASSVAWSDVADKPSTFAPATHTHSENVPTSRTIAGLSLSGNITTASLVSALQAGGGSPACVKSTTTMTATGTCTNSRTTTPNGSSSGEHCWCRYNADSCSSSWAWVQQSGGGSSGSWTCTASACTTRCQEDMHSTTSWPGRVAW